MSDPVKNLIQRNKIFLIFYDIKLIFSFLQYIFNF